MFLSLSLSLCLLIIENEFIPIKILDLLKVQYFCCQSEFVRYL